MAEGTTTPEYDTGFWTGYSRARAELRKRLLVTGAAVLPLAMFVLWGVDVEALPSWLRGVGSAGSGGAAALLGVGATIRTAS